jgi:hypothetical protein
MAAIRQYRALIAWLGLVALIGNLITGVFCSAPSKRTATDLPVELVGAMVICTEHGEQTLPDEGAPPPQKPCQICIAAAGLLLTLVVATLLALLPLAPQERIAFAFVTTVAHRHCRAGLGSRAPPLPA